MYFCRSPLRLNQPPLRAGVHGGVVQVPSPGHHTAACPRAGGETQPLLLARGTATY